MSDLEKIPLLGNNVYEVVDNKSSSCLSLSSVLAKPLQFFTGKNPQDDNMDQDSDSDEPMLDLPYKCYLQVLNDDTGQKLVALRKLMKEHGIGVYLIPSEDEHQSEYTALTDRRREFISGFNGSAGIAIVTLEDSHSLTGKAVLSTDGRYFLQAEKQLDKRYWALLKQGTKGYETWQSFAIKHVSENKFSNVLSCDPRLISVGVGSYFDKAARESRTFKFQPLLETNLIDEIWSNQPVRSEEPIYHLPLKYSGESTHDKLVRIRIVMSSGKYNAGHLIVTSLDEIAWLFNLRSDHDVPFNPVFFSYAIVTLDAVFLYINKKKVDNGSTDLKNHLAAIENLHLKDYNDFFDDLREMTLICERSNNRWLLPSKTDSTYALVQTINSVIPSYKILHDSVISNLKIVKNPTELFNAKIAQLKDSLVFILFASWLEDQLIRKKRKLTEYDAACKIYTIRTKFPNFKGLSYETIASTGANAAIIHYAPTKENNSVIDPSKVFLLDSGCHFLEGTTDITRTFKFGFDGISAEYKKYYTLVLKGHLAVAMAKFPPNSATTGTILDCYSRQALWNEGLDFNHGTGHGVGSFGNVHEGPLYILTTSGGPNSQILFKPGGIVSDEPGYYIDGEVGFRIESELEIIETKKFKTRFGESFLAFAYLTKVPFCRKLIDTKYLSPIEIKWINEYHWSIRNDFEEKLKSMGEFRALKWLQKETEPLL
jgi:Xaa-Pro aminopeptidase